LVIFCVAFTEAMRLRSSLSEAIRGRPFQSRHPEVPREARPRRMTAPSPFEARPLRGLAPQGDGAFYGPMGGASRKRLREGFDRRLELARGLVAEIARRADGLEDVGVLRTDMREQPVLERLHAVERQRIEEAVSAGPDHDHLLFHLERRELRLLEQLGEA